MNVRTWSRLAVILGAALLGLSFFMPFGFMHAPFGMMKWMADAMVTAESTGEALAFSGATVVIVYPYAWALLVVAAALRDFSGKRGVGPWLHVAVHTLGGLVLMALCITLLLLRDPWLPAKLQWTGASLPVAILLPLWAVARFAAPARRGWLVIAVGLAPQVLFQIMLAFVSVGRAGQAEGFIVGAAGALLALAGAAGALWYVAVEPNRGEP